MRALFGHDQRTFELPGFLRVDAEVGGQLHRAAHALWNETERPVGKYRRVERRIEIVGVRYHAAEIFPHQFRMITHGFRERTEDNAGLGQLLFVGGGHRHAVEDHVHRNTGERRLFVHRHAQFLEGAQQLRIDFIHRVELLLWPGRGVIAHVLEIDPRILHVRPVRLLHGGPVPEGLEAELQQPFRLVFLL